MNKTFPENLHRSLFTLLMNESYPKFEETFLNKNKRPGFANQDRQYFPTHPHQFNQIGAVASKSNADNRGERGKTSEVTRAGNENF
jgi:hypothetical protein